MMPGITGSVIIKAVEANYLRHIEQIGELITENADIVESLCAGILGPWGEWHSDDDYVAVINICVLRYLSYSTVLPLTSLTYIGTMIVSRAVLKEKMNLKKTFGAIGLLIGAILIA
jgi:hypothetical protein